MRTKRSTAGLTLLEVVIAVSLLSLLMVGVMTSLRLGLGALGKTNSQLMTNRRVAGAQRVLEGQLEGFMPVIALYGGVSWVGLLILLPSGPIKPPRVTRSR